MYLKPGLAARLVLTDGTTLAGIAARSRRWGVYRINKARIFTRTEPVRVAGHFFVPARNVLFVQISPPELEDEED